MPELGSVDIVSAKNSSDIGASARTPAPIGVLSDTFGCRIEGISSSIAQKIHPDHSTVPRYHNTPNVK